MALWKPWRWQKNPGDGWVSVPQYVMLVESIDILYMYARLAQIIQEMELILKKEKSTLIRHFKREWQTKWVTAIIVFAESYTKKSSAAVEVRDYGIY